MRLLSLLPVTLAAIVLSVAGLASADLCEPCKGKAYTKDLGTCKACGGTTSSGQFELCLGCSGGLRECEHCRAALVELATPDVSKDGDHKAGRWAYQVRVSNPGSKSEGVTGELRVDARPVAVTPAVNDYLKTPWGLLWWVGNPTVSFGAHGWMPRPAPARAAGRLLPDPVGQVRAVLWMTHLLRRPPAEGERALDAWIADALRAQGVAEPMAAGGTEALGASTVVLHDSKHYGLAEARLVRATPGRPVSAEIRGTAGPKVELAFRDGETLVVKHVLESQFGPYEIWLAFRLEISTPPPPPPARAGGDAPR